MRMHLKLLVRCVLPILVWAALGGCATLKEAAGNTAEAFKGLGSGISDAVRGEESADDPGANGADSSREEEAEDGSKGSGNESLWDRASLDTARDAAYLTKAERAVVFELNKVRSNPAAYATAYLEPRRRYYQGQIYRKPGEIDLATKEGVRALDECIRVLKAASARPPLQPSRGLSRAAEDHVQDTGPKGITGHVGADGSDLSTRVSRYGQWGGYLGENISYGSADAREIVVQLIVDDGVPSRGHRKNIRTYYSRSSQQLALR